jgi:hypothetical protein
MQRTEKITMWIVRFILLPFVQLLAASGAAIVVTGRYLLACAAAQSHAPAFNIGISPTSMMSGNMPQAAISTFYDRDFFENLKANTVKMRMCTRRSMPEKAGQTYRGFMWPTLPANTVQQTEGTVGTGISITANFQDYQLGQWADYINVSDKALVTSISDDMVNLRREMSYRLALSIDDLVMAIFDYLRTLDTKTANQDAANIGGAPYPFVKQMIQQAPWSLRGQNVKNQDRGFLAGTVHPFFVGDMVALDNSNNSIVDIMKHTPEGLLRLEELPDGEEGDQINVIKLFGCHWMESTNQTQTANYQGSGTTAIRTYLAGKDAVVAIKLDRSDRTNIDDGQYQNMTLWMGEYKPGQVADPSGVIGAGTSYNTILAFGPPPDTTSRARCWDAVPQTS